MNRRLGLVGGALGLLATGAAAAVLAERYVVGRARLAPDPASGEPFFALPADRVLEVTADDGVPLHVEEVGPTTDPALCVIFCHGYANQLATWHFQRQALAADPPGRLVFWDQRGHGRSGRGAPESATLEQCGRDLAAVIAACAPRGPVVLVGHSMGGMTIMALADAAPELFDPAAGGRVVGVALVATSPGKLAEVTFGLPAALTPVTRRALPVVTRHMRRRPRIFERTRQLGAELAFVVARRGAFGAGDVGPSLVEFVERMTAETPVDVIAEFYATFTDHDKLAALAALSGLPVLVLVGSRDIVTPVSHSRDIADALPHAEFVVVEGAGHMVQLEQPEVVTAHLRDLLGRALPAPARSA